MEPGDTISSPSPTGTVTVWHSSSYTELVPVTIGEIRYFPVVYHCLPPLQTQFLLFSEMSMCFSTLPLPCLWAKAHIKHMSQSTAAFTLRFLAFLMEDLWMTLSQFKYVESENGDWLVVYLLVLLNLLSYSCILLDNMLVSHLNLLKLV